MANLFYAIANIFKLILCIRENAPQCNSVTSLILVHIMSFIGNAFFFVGAFCGILEVVNQSRHPRAQHWTEKLDVCARKELPDEKWRFEHQVKLWAWRPREIAFWASHIVLIGVICFQVGLILARIKLFENVDVANSLGIWLPSCLGSLCFAIANYLYLIEQSHSFLPFKPWSLVWWFISLKVLASLLFLGESIAGFWSSDIVSLWETKFYL